MSELRQSTNHILMIEPAEFYTNPETVATNHYHAPNEDDRGDIFTKALREFRDYRDMLVSHGVSVTTVKGIEGCPDHIFPNWASTHLDGTVIFYPMLNENRQDERTVEMVDFFKKLYDVKADFTQHEKDGKALEATGSLCLDRMNKIAYCTLSARSDLEMAQLWAREKNYELLTFETISHTGSAVYHTDLVMFIGTDCVGICAESIIDERRDQVLASLRAHRDVIELSKEQLAAMSGNSLEVVGQGGTRYLAMSSAGHAALRADQIAAFEKHFDGGIISSPIPTIEKYGGGSARCLLMELF